MLSYVIHISPRILAFSLSDIVKVEVKVDNENWSPCRYVSGPLYVAEWNPYKYSRGLHHIRVRYFILTLRLLI